MIQGDEVVVSVTSGLSLTPCDRSDDLVREADAARYHAKRHGRGGTQVFHDGLVVEATTRLRRTTDLRRAVERGEIVPFYQPVVDLVTGEVVAVETLARWQHPVRGWVPPDEFIPLAETTGMIERLGQQLLDLACADAVAWLRDGRRFHLAVNASGVQLSSPAFLETIDSALQRSGLPVDQLTIEITETAAMRDPAAALVVLNALKDRGVLLSLDDFGTGYSPLTSLRDLPVRAIKLDRTFVAGLGSPSGDGLVAGIVQLALISGMHVVAEGVEHRSQADHLREIGCQFGQGYLWSAAVPGSVLAATVRGIEARTRQARVR